MAFDPNGIVTFTTDFGDSAYAGAMRGAALRASSTIRLVDVTHGVPAHDVTACALALRAAAPHFPTGTVHVAVVDPGVGSSRRAVLVLSGGHAFVGPDNGSFSLVAPHADAAFELAVPEDASPTFHGRDVFAPAAARVASGERPDVVGRKIEPRSLVQLHVPRPEFRDGAVVCRVLSVDRFGTLVTNVEGGDARDHLGDRVRVTCGEASCVAPFVRTYADVPRGEPLVLVGSSGLLDVSVNEGSASALLRARPGDTLVLAPARD